MWGVGVAAMAVIGGFMGLIVGCLHEESASDQHYPHWLECLSGSPDTWAWMAFMSLAAGTLGMVVARAK